MPGGSGDEPGGRLPVRLVVPRALADRKLAVAPCPAGRAAGRQRRRLEGNRVTECKKTADYRANMYYSGPPLEAARRLTVRTNYRS